MASADGSVNREYVGTQLHIPRPRQILRNACPTRLVASDRALRLTRHKPGHLTLYQCFLTLPSVLVGNVYFRQSLSLTFQLGSAKRARPCSPQQERGNFGSITHTARSVIPLRSRSSCFQRLSSSSIATPRPASMGCSFDLFWPAVAAAMDRVQSVP